MTDDACRPLKRARVSDTDLSSSPSSASASHFQRQDPEFWLSDGNIILVAKNGTAFRVYRGLIAAQSTVFEDMFVSSTSGADELFDGCPVVQLTDSSEDLTHLLRVLLPKSERRYHRTERRTFDELSAVIRLAHKYHIQDVQDQALAFLQETVFPSSFARWYEPFTGTHVTAIQSIGVVNIARLTNTPSLLPHGFYFCTYLGGKLFDGWTREDGTVEQLSTDDLRRCFDGQRALALEANLIPGEIFTEAQMADCTSPARCQLTWQQTLRGIGTCREVNVDRRALDRWNPMITNMAKDEMGAPARICRVCEKELLRRERRQRYLIWKKLPEIFGVTVEGWGAGGDEAGP
ncbi:hypothetical protein GSI_12237 [Ganoderma sinense ZZ0214-1]|uniref:BTB domain-containing protein n=1 Tax=Ganoderma sinense ZZ0214-1 TaxID=1077348 RepID=A0A2G8RY81_9APHY|nr:hypothetical protein GSI_12237 [Ganoderma sinense ZZ0214-1]